MPVPEDKLRLGGMALRNGLLVHGPTHWAAAVRTKQGDVKVASGSKPRVHAVDDIPGLRGLARLGEAFAVIPLVKKGLPEAKLAFENPSVLGVAAGASIAGTLLRRRSPGVTGEMASALIALAPALFALRGGELAAYHGVEHKAIAAYERDDEDAADAEKEHERCGSHLMAPMLAANLAGTLLLKRAVERPNPLAGGAVALASTAAAVEVFAWTERHADSPVTHALKRPGYELQRLIGTREPDERQLEVGRAAWPRSCASREIGSRPRASTPPAARRYLVAMDWWDHFSTNLLTWGPMVFMGLIVFFLWRTMKLMPKTKPQEIKPDSVGSIKWDEVAGADEAKAELQEVVDFLREPKRFRELGAKVPKGILLHGPPGTGKTLLAKAVANESGAQFFAQSASSFVEMFAGLGSARIRRLFNEARKHPRAIVFIDEIDAVGAQRGSDNNSEREQTLNQLLVEMDGFATTGELVVIAASNLLEKLDPALLRPGRFDRQILVSPPDVVGREAILRVHTRTKPLKAVDLGDDRAPDGGPDRRRPGQHRQRGRDRRRRARGGGAVVQADFENALERVVAGMQSRKALTEHERRVIAYHESGHALCSELLPGVDRTHRISIVPRGQALGYTLHFPDEDRYLKNALGADGPDGRAARRPRGRGARLRLDHDRRVGDLKRVADISRAMIHEWAMGTSVSALQLASEGGAVSDRTRELRDAEQQHLADEALRRAMTPDHRPPRAARPARRRAAAPGGARARGHRADHGRRGRPAQRVGTPARRGHRDVPEAGRASARLEDHDPEPAGADRLQQLRRGRRAADVDADAEPALRRLPAQLADPPREEVRDRVRVLDQRAADRDRHAAVDELGIAPAAEVEPPGRVADDGRAPVVVDAADRHLQPAPRSAPDVADQQQPAAQRPVQRRRQHAPDDRVAARNTASGGCTRSTAGLARSGTTSSKALARALTRSRPASRNSPSQLISVPGGSVTETTRPSWCCTARWRSTRWVRSPQARRTSASREPAGRITTSRSPSVASAAPIPEPPPNAPVQATITCHAAAGEDLDVVDDHADAQRAPGQRRAGGAERVGQRPEARLQRLRPARGHRGEAGAGDVHERPAVREPAELERAQLGPRHRPARPLRAGRPGSPWARAKSLAVPVGITASGTPRRPASSATEPIVPSPPATAIRSGPHASTCARSSCSQPKTSAPPSAAASGAGSRPPPEARLATRAIRTLRRGYTRQPCSAASTTSGSRSPTSSRRSSSTPAPTACRSCIARRSPSRASRPCCSTSARATWSC